MQKYFFGVVNNARAHHRKTGHTRDQCWAKGGGDEGGSPVKSKDGGNHSKSTNSKSKTAKAYIAKAKDNKSDVESIQIDMLHNGRLGGVYQATELNINGALIPVDTDTNHHLTVEAITPLATSKTEDPHPDVQ